MVVYIGFPVSHLRVKGPLMPVNKCTSTWGKRRVCSTGFQEADRCQTRVESEESIAFRCRRRRDRARGAPQICQCSVCKNTGSESGM